MQHLRLRSSDGSELSVPMEIAIQSQVVRQWHEEYGNNSCFILAHSSCTNEIVSFLFSQIWTLDSKLSLDENSPSDLPHLVRSVAAAIYLDMSSVLCRFATIPNLLVRMSADGCLDGVRVLIESKADIGSENSRGQTALSVAKDDAGRKELEAIENSARDHLEEMGNTPVMIEAILNNIPRLVVAIEKLADKKNGLEERRLDGLTALHLACEKGRKSAVDTLLKARADINATSSIGHTPLHFAAVEGRANVAAVLLAAGADHSIRTSESGGTALHHAAINGHLEVVQALISAKADLNCGFVAYSCMWLEEEGARISAVDGLQLP